MRREKRVLWRAARFTATALLLFGVPGAAQGVYVDGSVTARDGRDLGAFRGGYWTPVSGPLGVQLFGSYIADLDAPVNESVVRRYGGGGQLDLFRDGRGPFVVGSLEGGVETGGPDDAWASWTAGLGYTLPVLGVQLVADARWRGFLSGEPGGVQVGIGLGVAWGGGGGPDKAARGAEAGPVPLSTAASSDAVPAAGGALQLRTNVVATARLAMGQPYRYGGEGEGGFDCSGLIQYAYAAHGVTVPRVSTDQAQVGDMVDRAPEALEPGDILTFSSSPGGSKVSHVGLYVGDGRFIHSASSRGVSESRLSADDPNGAWWYARWTGARRIIPDS